MDETKRDPGNELSLGFGPMGPTAQGSQNRTLEDRGRPRRDLFEQNKLLYFRPLNRKTRSHFNFFVYVHDGKAGPFPTSAPPPPPPRLPVWNNWENSARFNEEISKKKRESTI